MNSGCFPRGTHAEAKRLLGWYRRGVFSWGEMVMALAGNVGLGWQDAAAVLDSTIVELVGLEQW